MKNIKIKLLAGILAAVSVMSLVGCTQAKDGDSFDNTHSINVVSREEGSGTRGAFIELLGIEEKTDEGKKDRTSKNAIIANKTGVMLTNIMTDEYSIGYVSMGSLSDDVKSVSIDGVEATAENVENGTYKLARPFVIAIDDDTSELAYDFIDFILSREGQDIVAQSYVRIDSNAPEYDGSMPAGKIVVAGSSSVTPVMEKLAEKYCEVNNDAEIEIQQTDSTAGVMAVSSGTADIGMASRDLKDSEKETLTGMNIATDAIAVIVNTQNPINELSGEQVGDIFMGKITEWDSLLSE